MIQGSILEAYIEPLLKLVRPAPTGFRYSSPVSLLVQEGAVFEPILWEEAGITKKPNRACYRNAGTLALARPDRYVYVEGLAVASENLPIPLEHAWVWDLELERAVEVTWETCGAEYIGIAFQTEWFRAWTLLRERWGVLDSRAILADDADPSRYRLDLSVPI